MGEDAGPLLRQSSPASICAERARDRANPPPGCCGLRNSTGPASSPKLAGQSDGGNAIGCTKDRRERLVPGLGGPTDWSRLFYSNLASCRDRHRPSFKHEPAVRRPTQRGRAGVSCGRCELSGQTATVRMTEPCSQSHDREPAGDRRTRARSSHPPDRPPAVSPGRQPRPSAPAGSLGSRSVSSVLAQSPRFSLSPLGSLARRHESGTGEDCLRPESGPHPKRSRQEISNERRTPVGNVWC